MTHSGGIPPELGNLANLEYLSLSNPDLSGSVPAELGQLRRFRFFTVQGQRRAWTALRGLQNLPSSGYDLLWREE